MTEIFTGWPSHEVASPLIVAASCAGCERVTTWQVASTVTDEVVLLQPVVELVNVNVALPAAIAVTVPSFATVATDGLLLTHVPPLVGDSIVDTLPIQMELALALTIGNGFTNTVYVAVAAVQGLLETVIVKVTVLPPSPAAAV
jgi:hypothetical protein